MSRTATLPAEQLARPFDPVSMTVAQARQYLADFAGAQKHADGTPKYRASDLTVVIRQLRRSLRRKGNAGRLIVEYHKSSPAIALAPWGWARKGSSIPG